MKNRSCTLPRCALLGLLVAFASLPRTAAASPVTLFSDSFNSENGGTPALNYNGFSNWNASNGTVDLIGNGFYDFKPGHGLYVDMDGSTNHAGKIETKTTFTLNPGTYTLSFLLGGSQRAWSPQDTVIAQLGGVYSQSFTMNSSDPFTTITSTITVGSATTGTLSFQGLGGDNAGLLLDDVTLTFDAGGQVVPEPGSILIWLTVAAGMAAKRFGLRCFAI